MNKTKIIELFKSGASFNAATEQFFHDSFKKGFRKLSVLNISFRAARNELGEQLVRADDVYKIKPN